ncbi:Probable CPS biosynthesis glycosyltransferase [uncultured Candidatus Thioglobus sp.]|nr:Probable CPS biosynthesis glycosyltransferase [uncultured Candidatus Thioglobus sp.]
MIKRLVDMAAAASGLIVLSPILLPVMFLVWKEDKKSPFYIAARSGRNGTTFKMVKLRSMVVDAQKSGVDSTSGDDRRITPIGHKIRDYKLDELIQLWNVLIGDMSLVGPRPNVKTETDLYTDVEKKLLSVRPGMTDFSSIVFSDEGDILAGKHDPDLAYNQLIRPWKSRLGLIYIENQSTLLDLQIILYTVVAIVSKPKALKWVAAKLTQLGADEKVVSVTTRQAELVPHAPPGSNDIVTFRG